MPTARTIPTTGSTGTGIPAVKAAPDRAVAALERAQERPPRFAEVHRYWRKPTLLGKTAKAQEQLTLPPTLTSALPPTLQSNAFQEATVLIAKH